MKKQLAEQLSKYEATEMKAIEIEQLEERRHSEEVHALERSIQQLKVPFYVFLLWQRSSHKCTVNNCSLILELFSHLGPNDTNRDNNGVTSSNMENSISFILHGCKNKTYQQNVFDRYKQCFYSFFLL